MLYSDDHKFEFVNYYGNTSAYALDVLRKHGDLGKMSLLSLATLVNHLADYLSIFRAVHHITMAETRLPYAPENSPARLTLHKQDFFTINPLDIDCIISHAAIHCFNDTRYGNENSPEGFQKPYQVPAKLREIAGDKRVPAIVSIAVNKDEGFFDNNTHLAHDKFVGAFEKSGFALQDYFFDYVCAGGIPHKNEYFAPEYRRSKQFPEATGKPREWVVGNYYFY
ncbi:MAG TPA: hypothetical protein VGG44_01380 [Tepidisphaeraceae bacterium]|jgi:hypothetical protein